MVYIDYLLLQEGGFVTNNIIMIGHYYQNWNTIPVSMKVK
jgi:hypothetical protein